MILGGRTGYHGSSVFPKIDFPEQLPFPGIDVKLGGRRNRQLYSVFWGLIRSFACLIRARKADITTSKEKHCESMGTEVRMQVYKVHRYFSTGLPLQWVFLTD
jgi:hypothetical protein